MKTEKCPESYEKRQKENGEGEEGNKLEGTTEMQWRN